MSEFRFRPRLLKLYSCLIILLLSGAEESLCQSATKDSTGNYYLNYDNDIIPRIYIADKVHNLKLLSKDGQSYFQYKPNINYRLGFGVTYRTVSINLDFAAGATNPVKGKTGSLDLQSNIYTKNWAIDLLLQSYKGYYISTPANILQDGPYYTNPDMRITFLGAGAWRVLNGDQFSYQAVMTQSEWQLRSAGSLLIGGVAYYGKVNAHNPMVPESIRDSFPQRNVEQLRFIKIGPGIGYAYTYVYEQHYFASAGLTTALEAGFVKETSATDAADKFTVQPEVTFRMGIGYNSEKWTVSIAAVTANIPVNGALSAGDYRFHTGNLRLTLARRFTPNSHTKQMLKRVDNTLDRIP